jgi:hypothetical protein
MGQLSYASSPYCYLSEMTIRKCAAVVAFSIRHTCYSLARVGRPRLRSASELYLWCLQAAGKPKVSATLLFYIEISVCLSRNGAAGDRLLECMTPVKHVAQHSQACLLGFFFGPPGRVAFKLFIGGFLKPSLSMPFTMRNVTHAIARRSNNAA